MSTDTSNHTAMETKVRFTDLVYKECRKPLFEDSEKWIVTGRLGKTKMLRYHWTSNEFNRSHPPMPNHQCQHEKDHQGINPRTLEEKPSNSGSWNRKRISQCSESTDIHPLSFLFSVPSHPRPQVIHELIGAKILGKRYFPLLPVKLWSGGWGGGNNPTTFFSVSSCQLAPDTGTVVEVCSRAGNWTTAFWPEDQNRWYPMNQKVTP